MAKIEAVFTDKAPKPLPQFSQAVKFNGMVYCSGNIGIDAQTSKIIEGTVKDRARQALKNLQAVLEEAGSSLHNAVKVNVFITTMDDFAAMNEAYDEFFVGDQKPGIADSLVEARAPHFFSTSSSVLSKDSLAEHHDESQDELTSDIPLSPEAANPPATTRPPPLELPVREPDTSNFSHLFQTGKAYLSFYKTGLKNIYLNQRLVWSLNNASGVPRSDAPSPGDAAAGPPAVRAVGTTTRSTFLLRRRVAHDVRRLPIFALLLVVCGELTPFVVLAFPRMVPLTCRIPKQVQSVRVKAEERREASLARLAEAHGKWSVATAKELQKHRRDGPAASATSTLRRLSAEEARERERLRELTAEEPNLGISDYSVPTRAEVIAHIARSAGLISPLWDRLPLPDGVVAAVARRKVLAHLAFLEEDDALLRQAGGAKALEYEELRLACVDRGIDIATVGHGRRSPHTIRRRLDWYLRLTGPTDITRRDLSPRTMEFEARELGSPDADAETETWARIASCLLRNEAWPPRIELCHRTMARHHYDVWERRL